MIKNVMELLEKGGMSVNPDKVAYKDKNSSITFMEIYKSSRAIASRITKENIYMQPVIVFMPKGIKSLLAFHGITYSGNIYVPIDINQPIERINNILKVLNPSKVIVNSETYDKAIKIFNSSLLLRFEECVNCETDETKLLHIKNKQISTDPLYILFTSGSTGIPKGVTINHQSVIDYIDWVIDTFNFNEHDIIANQAPFYFDNSVLDIYTTLKTGCSLYIVNEKNFAFPAKILKEIEKEHITTLFWVPSMLIAIANSPLLEKYEYKGLKRILFAGEVMPNKQLNIWRKNIPYVLYANLYGPTEITVDCLYYIVDREFKEDEPLPIGKHCSNSEVIILNENNELVKEDEVGEICVRGISLSMGYYNNPEKTADVFVQNPLNKIYPELIYRTGDLGYYNEYNEIMYVGRKDFQIKHSGYRIELGEIETAVFSIKEIENLCVLYNNTAKQITLFYTSKNELDNKYIREQLFKKIPSYAIPAKVYYLKNMPFTPNGKIDRELLKKEYFGE